MQGTRRVPSCDAGAGDGPCNTLPPMRMARVCLVCVYGARRVPPGRHLLEPLLAPRPRAPPLAPPSAFTGAPSDSDSLRGRSKKISVLPAEDRRAYAVAIAVVLLKVSRGVCVASFLRTCRHVSFCALLVITSSVCARFSRGRWPLEESSLHGGRQPDRPGAGAVLLSTDV